MEAFVPRRCVGSGSHQYRVPASILGSGRRVGYSHLTVNPRRPRAFPCTRRSRTARCARGRPRSTELSPGLGRRVIFPLSRRRCLGEAAPATCLVSSPAACAAAAYQSFSAFAGESAVWIDPSPRSVPRPAGERIAGRAGERRGASGVVAASTKKELRPWGTPRVTLCGATELGERRKGASYKVWGRRRPHSGC